MFVSQLLDSPSKICKTFLAVNDKGNPVNPVDESAVSWCIVGGIFKCYPDLLERAEVLEKFRLTIKTPAIGMWSDSQTFSEIYNKLIEAGI